MWSVYLKYFNIPVFFQVCNFAFTSRGHLYVAGQLTPEVPISVLVPHLPRPWNLNKCREPFLARVPRLRPKETRLSPPLESGHSQKHTWGQDSLNTLCHQPERILTQMPFRPVDRLLSTVMWFRPEPEVWSSGLVTYINVKYSKYGKHWYLILSQSGLLMHLLHDQGRLKHKLSHIMTLFT